MTYPSAAVRALIAAAILNFAVVNAAMLALGVPARDTDLHSIAWFLTGRQGGDSWRPMNQAYDFATTPEGRQKSLYEKMFFSPAVRHKGFQYPPTSLLAIGLSRLGGEANGLRVLEGVTWAFVPLMALCVGGILVAGLRRSGPMSPFSRADLLGLWAAAVLLTLTFYPAMRAYRNGQIQTWINGLFAAAVLSWLLDRKRASGALVGAMCLIKPQYAVAGIWGLLRREPAFLLGWLATVGLGGLVSLMLFGLAPHLEYVSVLSFIARRGESFYPNQSFNGLLNRALGNGESLHFLGAMPPPHPLVYAGTLATSVLLLAWALWPRGGAVTGRVFDFAMVVLAATTASPVAWEHHYGVLLPIFALLLIGLPREPFSDRARLVWLGAAFVLTSHTLRATDRVADSPLNVLQSYILVGALIVLVLLDRARSR